MRGRSKAQNGLQLRSGRADAESEQAGALAKQINPQVHLMSAVHSVIGFDCGRGKMTELRRLLPRQFADWRGKYAFEGDSEEVWHDCRVIDISTSGAGLELLDVAENETVGGHILLAIHLRGELRNAGPGRQDSLRAGVKFVGLSQGEIDYMDSLVVLGAKW